MRQRDERPFRGGGGAASRWLRFVVAVCGLLVSALAAAGAEPAPPPAPGAAEQPAGHGERAPGTPDDLTELSLEQLLQLEVIPINVLGSHTHLAGEWMVGYRFMWMDMEGERIGTRRVSHEETLQTYPVTHTRMTMRMHMLEAMYAPTDALSLMAMLPHKEIAMDHITRTGGRFTTRSEGIGDLMLMALSTLRGDVHKRGARWLLNAGISVPTGSIDERDDTPTTQNAKLEYMMQLGSGTWDLLPGVTYLYESETWALGAQALGTIRLGKNDEGYRLGNELRLTGWAVYSISDSFAPSLRIEWFRWGRIHGRDPELNPAANPANDPDHYKGRRLDLFLGVNLYAPSGTFKGHRLTAEVGWPLYQSLAGPQLETDWQASVGWSYVFR